MLMSTPPFPPAVHQFSVYTGSSCHVSLPLQQPASTFVVLLFFVHAWCCCCTRAAPHSSPSRRIPDAAVDQLDLIIASICCRASTCTEGGDDEHSGRAPRIFFAIIQFFFDGSVAAIRVTAARGRGRDIVDRPARLLERHPAAAIAAPRPPKSAASFTARSMITTSSRSAPPRLAAHRQKRPQWECSNNLLWTIMQRGRLARRAARFRNRMRFGNPKLAGGVERSDPSTRDVACFRLVPKG